MPSPFLILRQDLLSHKFSRSPHLQSDSWKEKTRSVGRRQEPSIWMSLDFGAFCLAIPFLIVYALTELCCHWPKLGLSEIDREVTGANFKINYIVHSCLKDLSKRVIKREWLNSVLTIPSENSHVRIGRGLQWAGKSSHSTGSIPEAWGLYPLQRGHIPISNPLIISVTKRLFENCTEQEKERLEINKCRTGKLRFWSVQLQKKKIKCWTSG